ncbi:MAG: tRNA (adenosine(37)-N6)-threonylcarbamoyltransferase complex dimerization subunit type 1 TsaB [Methylomonas sp.]|nr:tRNA (adenosine(37)-N6)-threonylcarbamoyltransferase complex dimerization subunit type 1 TsaB [Methylomonas sp.]PPD21969.1 MAG: tRNA (adenosine(37)-N6)-threonylcarbamoyltransferase complex dimerization subunit type 1 TsaB [Methylomonas sp.]PPD23958.1 MAG: tRNA (adenosine(37)-N6)-threonylcarbamoyltransferase complex dimerization subunit type 1 TsaB [Methylomonas sp.]PPD32108.1 MAG: tRNA (adenosine(37)-N6)-threonylcarbamoyltransferase complex dimerization subunit type 1 TsaB [Methylomonas sp.]
MKLLALDTSTDACSAALFIDGDIRERFEIAPREHTHLIMRMIDELMQQADLRPQQLDAIALSRGPGSFTGVRIATGVAHGIAFAAGLPVAMVSTLAAMAQDFFNHSTADLAFTALDARMDEVFWGVYRRSELGLAELVGDEAVAPASQVIHPDLPGHGIGSGWAAQHDALRERLGHCLQGSDTNIWPKASCVAQLGAYAHANGLTVTAEQAQPVYLRDKVAKKPGER